LSPLAIAAASGMAWFAIFVATHIVWTQITREPRYSRIIVRCFALSLMGSVATIALAHGVLWYGPSASWLVAEGASIFLMCCAFVLYMPFVFVIATSLSVDTMLILHRAGRSISRAELYASFVSIEPVRHRLDVMCGNGLLALHDGRYGLTRKGVRLARFFTAMKRMWNLWPGG